ncbi:MAG TPA: type II toxin-antitoxin system death-on-curing family toxin [Chloroflexota bacterium]|jgi:death-on-curing protein
MTLYITPAEALRIHAEIMARACAASELLDEGKLESALLRPTNAAYYEGADLFAQAATLIAGMALAHAFSDGNKRLAAALGVIFPRANGVAFTGDHIELADEVLRIVNRTEALPAATERLASWLRTHSETIPRG